MGHRAHEDPAEVELQLLIIPFCQNSQLKGLNGFPDTMYDSSSSAEEIRMLHSRLDLGLC